MRHFLRLLRFTQSLEILRHMWTPVEEIDWSFGLDDFPDPIRLLKKILRGDDPVSQYLLSLFSPAQLELFREVDGGLLGLLHNPIVAALIDELNKILPNTDLYDPVRFANIKLSGAAETLIERLASAGKSKALTDREQLLLNRKLLESAYPDEMVRSGEIRGLAAEIVNFFDRHWSAENGEIFKTIHDFLDNCGSYYEDEYPDLGFEIRIWCHRLMAEGFLFPAGFDPTQGVPYNERFMSGYFSRELAAYGSYEFVAFGFPKVIKHFAGSVIPIEITANGETSVATGFLIDDARIVTAQHCVDKGARIRIQGWDAVESPLSRVLTLGEYRTDRPCVLGRGTVDVAVLEFESDPFPDKPKFKLWGDSVLDEILVLGHPRIDGFESGLIASTGEIISKRTSTARNQPLIIFSASVKGGNSGGPVINRYGKVIGMVTNLLPAEGKDIGKFGYGVATSAQPIFDLVNLADGRQVKDKEIYPIAFAVEEGEVEIRT